MALPLYQLVTASILFVVGVILLGWRLGKERTRPEAITTIGALCLVCAGSFVVSWALSSPEPTNWQQSVVYTIRAIPYDAGLIALSYSPTVFGLCWITAFFFAFLANVPALEEYGHFPLEFLLLKFRNIPELVWPALAAVVFARELIQRGEPSMKLRVQHASFLIACLGFVGLSAAAMWVNYLKVMVDPVISTYNQVSLMLTVESVALAVAGIGWICGAILDDSSEEANKLADEIESWIEIRHELESMIDQELGGYLSGGRGIVGNARMIRGRASRRVAYVTRTAEGS